jgi:hypothetical protein
MSQVKRMVLDVLKPHIPNALDFAKSIADNNPGCTVTVTVVEMDEKTETTIVTIQSNKIIYEQIADTITNLGGSIHSIDEVTVSNTVQNSD